MIDFHGMHLLPSRARAHLLELNWAGLPLHAPDTWPAVLKTAAELCLNAGTPMLLVWGEDEILFGNDRALTVMGLDPAASLGRPLGATCPQLADVLRPLLRSVKHQSGDGCADDRLLLIERAGRLEEVYLKLSGNAVHDPSGQVAGVLCIVDDSTVQQLRKRRTSTLGRLNRMLSKLPSRDLILPEIQKVLADNPLDFAGTALFELQPGQNPVVRWAAPLTFADELLSSCVVEDIATWLPAQGAHRFIRPLGERRYALCMVEESLLERRRFAMIVEPDPRVRADEEYELLLRLLLDTAVGAAYRVLLDRQTVADMEVKLGERDRLYRALFEHSHDCVLICGPGGRILAANPAACDFLGYSEDELRVAGRGGIVDDEDGALSHALAARDRDKRFVGELTFRRKDGSGVPVDVSSTLFEDASTGHGRAVVFFRDAEPRLASQRRIATAARLQAVGELTGGIAHDFNNLLNVIINGAEILAERLTADPVARPDADLVLSASLRAAELTRQLLAFSRQQPMQPAAVDLHRALREMDQILDRALSGSVAVTLEVKEGLTVRADPALLQSAILNLCINARDAMPDGGRLWISGDIAQVDRALADELGIAAGPYALVRVKDEGVGIPPEDLSRVLEPFFTTKPSGKGTGLGLSSVFGFVRQTGGGMSVLSKPGVGTTVELYLPPAPASAVRVAEPAAPVPNDEPRADRQRKPVVLVVEDDDLFSAMLSGILERAGYRVVVRSTGDAAISALREADEIDLLITDILLGPGADGWMVARHAREVRPHLPVITMSGFAPPDDGDPATRVTLTKPFRPREILAAVDKTLKAA